MDLVYRLDKEQDYLPACVRQERWAQELLYKDYYPMMMPVCMRYSNNDEDALDILHEGFIKVFRHIHKYQLGTSLTAWIKRIMVNTAIDFYRRRVRRRTEDLDTAYSVKSTDPNALNFLAAEEIIQCLNQLSPSYRSIFNLYVIEGYSHREIAEQLGISESTSRSNLVKARSKLRTLLKAKGTEYDR
ncbi:MAG: sigma-70 family RNA polymerase sigma factor [Bacteroidota bacterium]